MIAATPLAPDLAALFLDFDGTLVEIAPRPDAVTVPPGLPGLLTRLADRFGGALAVVSGRPLAQLEALLPVPLAMAGDHGASLRPAPGAAMRHLDLPVPPAAWLSQAEALAAGFPGALVERKAHGFVLHYRLAPEAAAIARATLERMVGAERDFVVMPARMAWEVKPRAVSKATAVAGLMAEAAFAGRQPVFIGDDVTDEAGMEAARAAGGYGLRLQDAFGTPAGLRRWLAQLDAGA
jgi:trehalose 6-phosphate phosphatase